jgi:hypothetical protein
LVVSLISLIRSSLFMRGTILRWWRFVRTDAEASPVSARFFRPCRSESSRA